MTSTTKVIPTPVTGPKPPPFVHLSAGAASGLFACTVLQPLDLIKTRLQQQRQQHLAFLKEAKGKGITIAPMNSTIYSTIKDIVNRNGVQGLWRGTVPTIIRNVPGSAAYFLALSEIRAILDRTRLLGGDKNRVNLVAGAAARAAVGFVMMPITVVKVRYEVVIKSSYSHTLSAHRALYSESAEQLLQLQKPIRCLLLHPTERWRTRTLRRVRRDGHTGRPLRWDLRVILRAVEDEVAWYAWRTGILVSFHTFAACGRRRVLALIYRHPIFLHAAWATSHDKTVANAAVNLTSGTCHREIIMPRATGAYPPPMSLRCHGRCDGDMRHAAFRHAQDAHAT
ncbi:mitochondrial carrier domain-containing protein [Jimgerdemannia flammicorona]|uniref:Mitochondrial carrier domain-containing protein n=1 Tax=Jimgerdemannia flammicorona TaxID=994334 RepID=A0A433Q259_9FUNG|nr:mitochondrial carrier domain-containing protein [Jimgerdemannia flammicorona]